MTTTEKIVELHNVNIYQQKAVVLSNITLDVYKGEFIYIVGKTGYGKSSLLKLLYGDLSHHEGKANVCGYDLSALHKKDIPMLRRHLGIVFQDFHLLTDRSVDDNLRFALEATGWEDKVKMRERMNEVLTMVGLSTKGFKMPHELSGGEQQRVVVARALLNHPKLILADEPTGNLDPETSEEIILLLRKICKEAGTAVMMASHDFIIMNKYPDRTLKCENGHVIDSQEKEAAQA